MLQPLATEALRDRNDQATVSLSRRLCGKYTAMAAEARLWGRVALTSSPAPPFFPPPCKRELLAIRYLHRFLLIFPVVLS